MSMLKITETLESLDLKKYVCNKYWIDDDYRSCRIIIHFTLLEDNEWKCERAEYIQNDVCNRRDKGDCIKQQVVNMKSEDVLNIINDFVIHTICTISTEYSVWGYDNVTNEEYDKKMRNTRYK